MLTNCSWRTCRIPLLLTVLWCLLLCCLYAWMAHREDEYADGLARIQTATLFAHIVDTRAWNARHGGVWVPERPESPANKWLPEHEREVLIANGQRLIKVNPAYMTRQIAEQSSATFASFRISSLYPIRPANRADAWEAQKLTQFHENPTTAKETFACVRDTEDAQYRFIAPLLAEASCLTCHVHNSTGDVLGGISVSMSASPILNAAAERKRTTAMAFGLIGIVGIMGIGGATLQINHKKEQAEAANRTKSIFLANMSHDMRTPLAGISGMAELLRREAATPRQEHLLANLHAATGSLLTLVDNIMHYSLLESEGQPIQQEPFALRSTLETCLAALRPACERKGLQLHLVISSTIPDTLRGDSFRLTQALGNLLGNAVKFTEEGSVTLTVSQQTSPSPSRVCLIFTVTDTGVGILPEEQQSILKAFEQGSATVRLSNTEPQGAGLGLAIVRQLVHRFGGELTIASTPHQGSTLSFSAVFTLESLPSTPTAATAPSLNEAPAPLPAQQSSMPFCPSLSGSDNTAATTPDTPCLVIVEDNPVTALFLRETLKQAGYARLHTAHLGSEGCQCIQRLKPHLVLLDMRLPDMTGLDIVQRLRTGALNVAPHTPILILSASLSAQDETLMREYAVNGWFLKPVSTATLLHAVAALLPSGAEDSSSTTPPLMALDEALTDMDGNKSLLTRLCTLFLTEADDRLAELRSLRATLHANPLLDQTHSLSPLLRLAHSLKNSAAMLHLPALHHVSAALEDAVRDVLANIDQTSAPAAPLITLCDTTLSTASATYAALRQTAYGANHVPHPHH